MLILEGLISQGATRACYKHPHNDKKCVKILFNPKQIKLIYNELKSNQFLQKKLKDMIPGCDEIVKTNLGLGLVMDLIYNDDNQISPSLLVWQKENQLNSEILNQFEAFFLELLNQKLWFYDFNDGNFVIQKKGNQEKVIFIDTKSFNHNNSWSTLKLEYFIPTLARWRMKRRIQRFYSKKNIPIPPSLK